MKKKKIKACERCAEHKKNFTSMVIFSMSFIFILSALLAFMQTLKYETVEDIFIMNGGIKEFTHVKEIYCEPGPVIIKHSFDFSNKYTVFGCLKLTATKDGLKCSGEGTRCYVKYRRRE